jgi:hypothetical protein
LPRAHATHGYYARAPYAAYTGRGNRGGHHTPPAQAGIVRAGTVLDGIIHPQGRHQTTPPILPGILPYTTCTGGDDKGRHRTRPVLAGINTKYGVGTIRRPYWQGTVRHPCSQWIVQLDAIHCVRSFMVIRVVRGHSGYSWSLGLFVVYLGRSWCRVIRGHSGFTSSLVAIRIINLNECSLSNLLASFLAPSFGILGAFSEPCSIIGICSEHSRSLLGTRSEQPSRSNLGALSGPSRELSEQPSRKILGTLGTLS